MRTRLLTFIAVFQAVLLLTHWFVYKTWTYFPTSEDPSAALWLKLTLGLLSISFVTASLLAFRYTNTVLRVFYRIAAVWLGLLSFLFLAACFFWVILGVMVLAGLHPEAHRIVEGLFAAAIALGGYAVVNAHWTRVRYITVSLDNLPEAWHGRKAALLSDLHLGHVRNGGFLRRTVAKVMREEPDIIFVAGDLYDGTEIDEARAAEPLRELQARHGSYFVAGNHEQFRDDTKYLRAVARTGVRVLLNEKVDAEGLQIIGVPYNHATHDGHFRSVLQGIGVDRKRASILLTHAPDRPSVSAQEGVSLQLSGHTHLGQFHPWTWMARRMYGPSVYGLSRIGPMQLYTSSGVGTWGPPLRWGSYPEIVVIRFE